MFHSPVLYGAFIFADKEEEMSHEEYMRLALELAKKATGFTSPNPIVGAVIVRDGEIIGQGYHKRYGDLHAERNAFAECDAKGIDCTGADMYVTLEPCCHHGKQPPCTEAVIAHGIKRVFVGSSDPNPLVSGKGSEQLRRSGIEVHEGILRSECDKVNEIFFHYITHKRPFVTMKYAMTMDGKIACTTGESKWITGEEARRHVHFERLRHTAIMAGVGTVIADDPLLTCRLEGGRDPIRIICDSTLRMPLESSIVKTAADVPTIIASACSDPERIKLYMDRGCEVITAAGADGRVDLWELMRILGEERGIDSILLEGGGELNWSALKAGIVNKVQAYIAPKIFGGNAKTPVSGEGVLTPSEAYILETVDIVRLGEDHMIESMVRYVHRDS